MRRGRKRRTRRAPEHEPAAVPLEEEGEVRAAALADPAARRLARPEAALVEEPANAIEDQEWRLRQAIGVSRGLDDVHPCDPTQPMSRRRLYLMRHAEVSYFLSDGSPVNPTEVPLNADGVAQAHAVAEAFRTIDLDRVVTSGLPRTLETAAFVAPGVEPESWPELREIQGGRLSEIPADALEREFVHAFRGVIPNDRGSSAGSRSASSSIG